MWSITVFVYVRTQYYRAIGWSYLIIWAIHCVILNINMIFKCQQKLIHTFYHSMFVLYTNTWSLWEQSTISYKLIYSLRNFKHVLLITTLVHRSSFINPRSRLQWCGATRGVCDVMIWLLFDTKCMSNTYRQYINSFRFDPRIFRGGGTNAPFVNWVHIWQLFCADTCHIWTWYSRV